MNQLIDTEQTHKQYHCKEKCVMAGHWGGQRKLGFGKHHFAFLFSKCYVCVHQLMTKMSASMATCHLPVKSIIYWIALNLHFKHSHVHTARKQTNTSIRFRFSMYFFSTDRLLTACLMVPKNSTVSTQPNSVPFNVYWATGRKREEKKKKTIVIKRWWFEEKKKAVLAANM